MGRKFRKLGNRNRRRLGAQVWRQSIQRRTRVEVLEPRVVLAADPLINEFQADNETTLADGEGDYEDWIEIHNPGTEEIDLSGWHLTDDKVNLDKWAFPAETTLEPGGYLVVFASNKYPDDMAGIPDGELHTNFRLANDGEYLGLIKPDAITVTQEFDPYPAQLPDQSYGLAPIPVTTTLIDDDVPVTAFVPSDDSLGTTWTGLGFDDAAWPAGTTGVGYEELLSGGTQRDEFESALGPEWTVDIPPGGSGTVTMIGGGVRFDVPSGQNTSASDQRIGTDRLSRRRRGRQFPRGLRSGQL